MSAAFKTTPAGDAFLAERRALISKIHVAKAKLGLDEDTYRDMLERHTGFRSAKDCSVKQLTAVIGGLQKAGFQVNSHSYSGPAQKMANKVRALWISGWNLGIITDPSDKAMDAFILRQTGIAKVQWLKDATDGAKVIDALKAWLAREGHVDWKSYKGVDSWQNLPGYRVCLRQWELYWRLEGLEGPLSLGDLQIYATSRVKGDLTQWRNSEWAKVSKALGIEIRKALKQQGNLT